MKESSKIIQRPYIIFYCLLLMSSINSPLMKYSSNKRCKIVGISFHFEPSAIRNFLSDTGFRYHVLVKQYWIVMHKNRLIKFWTFHIIVKASLHFYSACMAHIWKRREDSQRQRVDYNIIKNCLFGVSFWGDERRVTLFLISSPNQLSVALTKQKQNVHLVLCSSFYTTCQRKKNLQGVNCCHPKAHQCSLLSAYTGCYFKVNLVSPSVPLLLITIRRKNKTKYPTIS